MTERAELFEKLPNGELKCSRYAEYLRITKQADTGDIFCEWLRVAYTILKPPPVGTLQ